MIHAAQVLEEGYAEVMRENLYYLVEVIALVVTVHVAFFLAWTQAESRRLKLCLQMGWEVGTLSVIPEWAVASCMGIVIVVAAIYPPYCLWVAFWEYCYPYLVFHGLPLPFPFNWFG